MKFEVLKTNWILEEIAFLFALALPTSIECLTEGLQMKLSNIFIGRSSGNNIEILLSALFIGQTAISLISYPIAEGIALYVNILCSQAYGAKQYKLVGFYFHRALLMATLVCFPVFTILISVRPIVYLVFQDWELAEYSGSYTDILCFGYPAYLYYKIGIRFLQALNIVWGPALYLLIGITLNGIIQYILIFQYNTNIQGAAAGYVISNYLVALLVFSHIQLSHVHKTISHEWSIELISDWYHTSKYAISTIVQTLVSSAPLVILPILAIGVFANDKRQLAIYSIIYSIGWVTSLGIMGFSSAITVRVGNLLGADDPKRAKKAAVLGIVVGPVLLALVNLVLLGISEPLSHLFTTDTDFAKELAWNIMWLSFLLNCNSNYIIQGVMNACCKQRIQTVLKFILQIFLGTIATFLLVNFVKWKALSIYFQVTINTAFVMVIDLFILFCSDWRKIASVVKTNTETNTSTEKEPQRIFRNLTLIKLILRSKAFILSRYLVCLAVSITVFTTILILKQFLC
ncbi:Multidrug and toxin extrusion protein 1 [Oopsacas minuta]|uniref:Multidrug and toxin extrusion protein n=1 Tax=Oopsacas minuta TaxID=111878 RepID=A0AAV7JQV9_9METZ|nr:Multidrug and toxin extrusion protein 1 [Oopsacas minuta]